MKADLTPLLIGFLIYLASLISLRFGLSVAIIRKDPGGFHLPPRTKHA